MKHIVSVDDLTKQDISDIGNRALRLKRARLGNGFSNNVTTSLSGKLMVTDFFEPSTRTRFSCEAAMTYLGGHAIGSENAAEFSSYKKGESIEDNFRVVSGYCDIIVGRFLDEGDARRAADASIVPLINGGDGTGEHPTQALIDVFSVAENFHLHGDTELNIVFFGDNKRSRTVQSVARMLASYDVVKKMTFVSHNMLTPDQSFIDDINRRAGREICEVQGCVGGVIIPDVWENAQIVYVTRSQNERGNSLHPNDELVFLPSYLAQMPKKSLVMHPLPRNSELPREIDTDPRAYYFEQAHNGLYVRMALLEWLFAQNKKEWV